MSSNGREFDALRVTLSPAVHRPPTRGDALLLRHCLAFDEARADASERLADELGPELAQLLVTSLARGRG